MLSPLAPFSRTEESCLARLRENQCVDTSEAAGASPKLHTGQTHRPPPPGSDQYSLLARDEIKSLVDQRVEVFHLVTRSRP